VNLNSIPPPLGSRFAIRGKLLTCLYRAPHRLMLRNSAAVTADC